MKKISKILLALVGVVLIALGIYCLCHPFETLFASAWLIGLLTLIAGILLCVFTFRTQKFLPNSATRILQAFLLVFLGVLFLAHKGSLTLSLPIIFSVWVLVEGVILAINSFDYKKSGFPGWLCILILGIAAAVMGYLGLRNPNMAGKTLSTFIGCGIIFAGVSYLVALLGIGRFEKKVKEVI